MSEARAYWREHLDGVAMRLESDVTATASDDRYSAETPGKIRVLANTAVRVAFDGDRDTNTLEACDAAPPRLEAVT